MKGAAPLSLVASTPDDDDGLFRCAPCAEATGHAVSAIVRVRRNPRLRGGRVVGRSGQDVWACAGCLARGVVTRVGA